MDRQALARALSRHAVERPDRAPVVGQMLELLRNPENPFARSALSPGHFTASAFVLCPARRQVLLVHHRRLGRWLQPGGHIEVEDQSLRAAAAREVSEETGVVGLTQLEDGIFDVDAHDIPGTSREGPHVHFDVRYLFLAPSVDLLASDEVAAVRWASLDDVADLNPEESVLRCIDRLRASAR